MNSDYKPKRSLDLLDQAIVSYLQKDPFATNKFIASQVGVSEVTIGTRIRAMENDRVMKVTAVRDYRSAGYNVTASVEVYIEGGSLETVAAALAKFDAIDVIAVMPGDPALSIRVNASSISALNEFIHGPLASIPGIRSIDTLIQTEAFKIDFAYAYL